MGTIASQITSLMIVYSSVYQAQIRENIKAPRHWPLGGEFTGDPAQMASYAVNVSIWWRHHEMKIHSDWPSIPGLPWKPGSVTVPPTQNARHQRLQQVCGNSSAGEPRRRSLRFLLVDRRHHVVYCYIPKVACSSWKDLLARLAGSNRTKTPVHQDSFLQSLGIRPMSLISSQDRREMLHTFSTFMFVRHLFDRLVSAYIDKFTTTSRFTVHFHKRYGCRIIKLFRANYTKGDLQKCNDVTFKEFVKYLIHLYQTGGSFEPHWRPFHELCDPCHVPYDFIGKMETMSIDKTFVLRNFFNTTEPSLPRRNSKGGHHKPYLDEITSEEKDMLYEVYKQDFLLFGYDKGV